MQTNPQQTNILLKQQLLQVTHELELLKIQYDHLLSEVAELKQKENQLKQLNDMMAENLNKSQQKVNHQITLKIEGEFLTQRIKQLETELQKYRSGVSDSVDRRVKKIVNKYTQEKQLQYEKRKSRLSLGVKKQNQRRRQYYETHEHKYYNIQYNTYQEGRNGKNFPKEGSKIRVDSGPLSERQMQTAPYQIGVFTKNVCQKCLQMEEIIKEKDSVIERLMMQLKSDSKSNSLDTDRTDTRSSEVEEWQKKYLQLLKLYQNLRQQHDLALDQFNDYSSGCQNNEKVESYTITQTPTEGFKKKQVFQVNGPRNSNPCESRMYNDEKERENQMLQQITNLVKGLGKGSKPQQSHKQGGNYMTDKKSGITNMGVNSKISHQSRLDGSVFTIKQGVNRYGNTNTFF